MKNQVIDLRKVTKQTVNATDVKRMKKSMVTFGNRIKYTNKLK